MNEIAESSSPPNVDRSSVKATGLPFTVPVAKTGPWTVRSTFAVTCDGGPVPPADGFANHVSVRGYMSLHVPLYMYAVQSACEGVPFALQTCSARTSMSSDSPHV